MDETLKSPRTTTRVRPAAFAVTFAAAFVVLYVIANRTALGQQWDAASLATFAWLRGEGWLSVYQTRDWLLLALLVVGAIAGVEAVFRRRWAAVGSSVALIAFTALASRAFKDGVLPRLGLGDFAYSYTTFPSGHTAIGLAAVVAIVWCGPRWIRPALVGVLGAVVGFIAIASLLSYAHRVSDLFGGALMTGALASAISAVAGVPLLGRAGMRAAWTIVGLAGSAAAATLMTIALLVLNAVDADSVLLIDSIGLCALMGVGGLVCVILANQYPMRAPATR